MARAPVYRAGTNPGGTPAFSGADPASFGAGVGRALQEVGDSMERRREREFQRRREEEAANAGVAMAAITGEIDVLATQSRETAAAGGEGHTEAVLAELDKRTEELLGGVENERVRQAYRGQAADLRARIQAREEGWQAGARVNHKVEQLDKTGTLLANTQATNPTPEGLEGALGQVEAQVGLLDLAENVKTQVVREQQRKVAAAWGNAMVERDHEALVAVIDAGALNPYLEPEDLDRLRDGALVEGRRRDAAERARLAAEEAEAREAIGLFKKRIAAGDQPSDEEFSEHTALAQQFGLEGSEFDIAVARSEVSINRETRDWTPTMFEQSINDLRAKGDSRSTGENVRLAQLERIRDGRVSEFVDDPQAHAARVGNPAPAVNWEGPTRGEIQRRATWARGYAQANGLVNPPYMSPEEMRPLKERAEQGAVGQLEVAQQLRNQWGAGIGGELATQLDPGNATLKLMVGLPAQTATWYSRGIEARKVNPKLFDRDAALDVWSEVAEAVPADFRSAVFEAAANVAAARLDAHGGDAFDERTFRSSIDFALGAYGNAQNPSGGIGEWRGSRVWLPPGIAQGDFERRLTRATGEQIVGAAVDARGQPSGRAPRYAGPDGRPGRALSPAQLRELELETVSPGVFRVRGQIGGVLVDDQGRPWQFDVRRIP